MIREAFAAIGCSMAIACALASLAHADTPIGYAPCVGGATVHCTPSLTSGRVAAPDWLRVAQRGSIAVVPTRVTDLHVYGVHGRALRQYTSRSGYAWRDRQGRLVAGYVRVDRTFYVYRSALLAGWEA